MYVVVAPLQQPTRTLAARWIVVLLLRSHRVPFTNEKTPSSLFHPRYAPYCVVILFSSVTAIPVSLKQMLMEMGLKEVRNCCKSSP